MILTQFLAFGLLSAASGGGGGSLGPFTETGTVSVPGFRTIVLPSVQENTVRSSGLPLGAVPWKPAYDPADHVPHAIDFTSLLATGEKIASIETVFLNATAALLGVSVDTASGFSPIIDTAGKIAQLWFVVDSASWTESGFDAGGTLLPVTMRVLTDSSPPKRLERSGLLAVRQS